MKKLTLTALATGFITCALFSHQAHATPLPPGGLVVPGPGTGQPPPGSTLVASLLSQPFTAATFSGTISSFVYSGDPANPNGGLDFVYVIHSNATSANAITHLGVGSFAGLLTDVVQNINGVGSAPAIRATRSFGGGDVVDFDFNLPRGRNTYFFNVRTNGTTYHTDTVGISDHSATTANALVPGTGVPDGGTTVALLGIALAGVEGLRRRFRARKT
jgi:VPDSG-CTERM motif